MALWAPLHTTTSTYSYCEATYMEFTGTRTNSNTPSHLQDAALAGLLMLGVAALTIAWAVYQTAQAAAGDPATLYSWVFIGAFAIGGWGLVLICKGYHPQEAPTLTDAKGRSRTAIGKARVCTSRSAISGIGDARYAALEAVSARTGQERRPLGLSCTTGRRPPR